MSFVGTTPASLNYRESFLPSAEMTSFVIEEREATFSEPKLPLTLIKIRDVDFEAEVAKKEKFLSFAGVWKDVDTEGIKNEIVSLRKKSTRAIKGL